jgi:predicted NAD-dependent protein-ADP-ribosyltransferase YbiA (DUF1768 family)
VNEDLMNTDWRTLLVMPTPEIIRGQTIRDDEGSGVLWSSERHEVRELSALGALAWEGHEDRPPESRYEWVGFNLLCNAAPTPFVVDGESFYSVDSFHEALKIPGGTPERATCAMSPLHEAQRLARRYRAAEFSHGGKRVAVRSAEHEGLLAAAIGAKVAQNPDVQAALRETGSARLVFPLTFSHEPGALGRVTPLALMIERWKRYNSSALKPGENDDD